VATVLPIMKPYDRLMSPTERPLGFDGCASQTGSHPNTVNLIDLLEVFKELKTSELDAEETSASWFTAPPVSVPLWIYLSFDNCFFLFFFGYDYVDTRCRHHSITQWRRRTFDSLRR
jgi:hypothetical protein